MKHDDLTLFRELIESAHDMMDEKELNNYLECHEKINNLVDIHGEQAMLAIAEFLSKRWVKQAKEVPDKYICLKLPHAEC